MFGCEQGLVTYTYGLSCGNFCMKTLSRDLAYIFMGNWLIGGFTCRFIRISYELKKGFTDICGYLDCVSKIAS